MQVAASKNNKEETPSRISEPKQETLPLPNDKTYMHVKY
jgi:hypothetical protein